MTKSAETYCVIHMACDPIQFPFIEKKQQQQLHKTISA